MKAEIPYDKAKAIADDLVTLLAPHCIRISIAGSIRRGKAIVGDVEIVAIPKPYQSGLFEDGIASIVNQWTKVKGELEYGQCKYTQRILPSGIKLDLFFAEPSNWGLILAIRTGSSEYSHKVLARAWVARGYHSIEGQLTNRGKVYEVREEQDLFDRLSIPYLEPKFRNSNNI